VLTEPEIVSEMSFSEKLKFVLSIYAFNGTWLGYAPLKTELQVYLVQF
jgi:hypothetical protein